jgi:hypothetical protein
MTTLPGYEIDTHETKVCSICGEEKHIHEFSLRSGKKENFAHTRQNRRNECSSCKSKLNKQTQLAKKYAGSVPTNHKCPICERNEIELRGEHNGWQKNNVWICEHNHSNGSFRDWICQHCNIGIGSNGFNENIKALENAIKYLKKHGVK